MSSIPLPALHLNPPPEQPNVLDQYARLQQLKNQSVLAPLQQQAAQQQVQSGALEVQQKQQALTDQKAMTTAMQSWDGKDLNALPTLVLKHGGSAQAVMGLKQQSLAMQKQASDIAEADATTGSKNLETAKGKNDMIAGALAPLLDPKQTPDAALPQAVVQTAQTLAQRGLLDPQHAQAAAQLAQSGDPNAIRGQIDAMRKGLMSYTQVLDEAKANASVTKDTAQAADATANAAKTNMEVQTGASPAMADSRYRNIQMAMTMGRPVSAEDKAFASAYTKQKTIAPTATFNLQNAGLGGSASQPSAMAQAVANGQMKWGDVISPRTPPSVKQQFFSEVHAINPNFNSGDYTVEQKARENFTSGNYSQQLNSINTAREHMKTFTSLADALDNGNVQALNQAGNAIGTQFGADKATNFNLAKQAFSSEVAKAFSGAGVTEGDRKDIGDKISAASSPAQLKGAAKVADELLAGKQVALQQTYKQSQQGSPNFGQQSSSAPTVTKYKVVNGQLVPE